MKTWVTERLATLQDQLSEARERDVWRLDWEATTVEEIKDFHRGVLKGLEKGLDQKFDQLAETTIANNQAVLEEWQSFKEALDVRMQSLEDLATDGGAAEVGRQIENVDAALQTALTEQNAAETREREAQQGHEQAVRQMDHALRAKDWELARARIRVQQADEMARNARKATTEALEGMKQQSSQHNNDLKAMREQFTQESQKMFDDAWESWKAAQAEQDEERRAGFEANKAAALADQAAHLLTAAPLPADPQTIQRSAELTVQTRKMAWEREHAEKTLELTKAHSKAMADLRITHQQELQNAQVVRPQELEQARANHQQNLDRVLEAEKEAHRQELAREREDRQREMQDVRSTADQRLQEKLTGDREKHRAKFQDLGSKADRRMRQEEILRLLAGAIGDIDPTWIDFLRPHLPLDVSEDIHVP